MTTKSSHSTTYTSSSHAASHRAGPRYIPLLPKPSIKETGAKAEAPATVDSKEAWSSLLGRGCKLQACRRPNCNLRTHHQRPNPYHAIRRDRCLPYGSDLHHEERVQNYHLAPDLSIIRGGVDGLPALPLEDGMNDAVFRGLFHQFCSYQYDRIRRIIAPPPTTTSQMRTDAELKARALSNAVSDPATCLNYVAATHQQVAFRRNDDRPDRISILLHGKVMQLLRAKLTDHHTSITDDIIHIIFTLVTFDIALGRMKSLHAHRRALQQLVSMHGGVHSFNRGIQIPYILSLDRTIAMLLAFPTLFPPQFERVRRPSRLPHKYGIFFEQSLVSSMVSQEVCDYCYDACRAIEMLEREPWSFDPLDGPVKSSPHMHYFYYHRECLGNHFVYLTAKTAKDRDLSRCVLLAAKIVDYIVLQHSFLFSIPRKFADDIQDIFCADEFSTHWAENSDIMLWIAFVLVSIPGLWEGRPEILGLIKRTLNLEYCSSRSWPTNWQQSQREKLRRFVWSDDVFDGSSFDKICRDIFQLQLDNGMSDTP